MSPFYETIEAIIGVFINQYVLSFLVIIGILLIATKNIILSRWHHTFDETHFSSQNFYDTLEATLKTKDINNLGSRRVTHKQINLVGARREYLRIYRKSHAFEICAAHVGTGCYVSWWFFEKNTFFKRVVKYIPIANLFLSEKTYHQIVLSPLT